jgi:hypothetical protein
LCLNVIVPGRRPAQVAWASTHVLFGELGTMFRIAM